MDPTTERPGALEALRRDHTSRKRFLRMGGAGVAGALALTLAACGAEEEAQPSVAQTAEEAAKTVSEPDPGLKSFGSGDVGIANYALTLEHIETAFYEKAVDSGVLSGEALELARRFGEQERDHVEALTQLIEQAGGKPASAPKTRFPLEDQRAILELAHTVEELGANAYLGQAARIESPEILAAALSIHSVEARHTAALAEAIGLPPAPDTFATPVDAATVLAAVKPFLPS